MFGTEDGKKLVYKKVESAVLNKIEDSSQIDEIFRQIAREAVEKIQIQLSHALPFQAVPAMQVCHR